MAKTKIVKKKLYDGEIEIDFYPNSHQYKMNGSRITSVTAVTKIIDKSAPLMYWAVNQMKTYLLNILEDKSEVTYDHIISASKEFRKVSDKAKNIGKEVHKWAEDFARSKIENSNPPEITGDTPEEVLQGIKGFLDWYNNNKVEFLELEKFVYSKTHNYCGHFDVLAKINNKLTLIDYKTSKRIYPEYFLQLAAYRFALEEEIDYDIQDNMVLLFSKEDGKFEIQKSEDYLGELEAFMSALKLSNHFKK